MILLSDRKVFYSNPGSPIKPVYSSKIDEKGYIELVQVGEENIQELIDSFAEETCIAVLVARCTQGDMSALSKVQGVYGDFSEVPTTYAELLQKLNDGRDLFDKLPVEIKEKFDNSFERWFSTIGDSDWFSAMKVSVDKKEVKDNEP